LMFLAISFKLINFPKYSAKFQIKFQKNNNLKK